MIQTILIKNLHFRMKVQILLLINKNPFDRKYFLRILIMSSNIEQNLFEIAEQQLPFSL